MREETRCCHMGYSFRLTARVLLYAPSHRQDSTYHSLCYTSHGALAETRNSSMGSPHEGSIRWPIARLEREIAQWVHHEGSIRWPINPMTHRTMSERSYQYWKKWKHLLLSSKILSHVDSDPCQVVHRIQSIGQQICVKTKFPEL